jgi:TolB-like protein/tetratricopeptide (TPR) repeat protein
LAEGKQPDADSAGPTAPRPVGAVFVSYASQDAEAAKRICDALRVADIEVWFDQSELRGGDVWDRQIRQQIHDCRLFVPIVSANTEARVEGYFRREWKLAVDRTHDLSERIAFLVPIVIDSTPETKADVPDAFRHVQWTRLPGGVTSAAFVERVRRLLSGELSKGPTRGASEAARMSAAPTSQQHVLASSRSTAALLVMIVVVVAALGYLVANRIEQSKHVAQPEVPPGSAAQSAPADAFNPPPHSIAVLPFVNMSGDAKQDYFSDGISEELLNSLSRLNDLQVVARTSSFSFKGQNVDVSTIAHKLNVAAVLEGSVRRAGNTVRITVQLINAVTGFHLWSQTYDRQMSDILKVQTEVASSVAKQLEIKLVGDEVAKIELGGTKNPEAYDAYLHGVQLYDKADEEANYRLALADADKAIKFDPDYAAAHVLRTNSLLNIYFTTTDLTARAQQPPQMLVAAQQAVRLAPKLGDAHLALAETYAFALFDFASAEPEYDRALSLAPGSALVQRNIAGYAVQTGHYDSAILAAGRAVALDPQGRRSRVVQGLVYYIARRYTEALALFEDLRTLYPDSHWVGGMIIGTLLASGQTQKALEECESDSSPLSADDRHQYLARIYHAMGRQSDAERELQLFKSHNGDEAAYEFAQLYSQLGDKKSALDWLETAYRLRDSGLQELKQDWQLDPIRDERRFQAILARMRFPP